MKIATKPQLKRLTKLSGKIDDLGLQVASLAEDVQGIVEQLQEKFDARSDHWQESEAGDEAQSFIDSWSEYADELSSVIETVTRPEID